MMSKRQVDPGALFYAFSLARHVPTSIVAHFLDIPLLGVMIYCGAVRPRGWLDIVVAVFVLTALATIVPRSASVRSRASAIHGAP